MDFPSVGFRGRGAALALGRASGRFAPRQPAHPGVQVYPDGREELVRGLRFRGFNARSLKDILAAGDDITTFEFLDNAAPFALMGGAGYVTNATVVAPSILIDDLELHPLEDELPKLPVVPAPELVR